MRSSKLLALAFGLCIASTADAQMMSTGFGKKPTGGGGSCSGIFTSIGGGQCRAIVTSGTSVTIPGNWNAAANSIEAIGGGGGGHDAMVSQPGGGGGAAYSRLNNVSVSGTQTIQIGAGGARNSNGTATWMRIDGGGTAPTTTGQGVLAQPGSGSTDNNGGAGGSSATSVGTTKNAGGN